jgi:hypothetical protein
MAVPAATSAGSGSRDESNDPIAHDSAAPTTTSACSVLTPSPCPPQHEHRDADEADSQAEQRGAPRTVAGEGSQHHEPQRHRRDKQRREAGRDVQLADRHESVAAAQQQDADERERRQLAPGHARPRVPP